MGCIAISGFGKDETGELSAEHIKFQQHWSKSGAVTNQRKEELTIWIWRGLVKRDAKSSAVTLEIVGLEIQEKDSKYLL